MAGSVNATEAQAIPDVQCNTDVLGKLLEHGRHPRVVHRVVTRLGGGNGNQGQAIVLMYLGPLPEADKGLCHLLDILEVDWVSVSYGDYSLINAATAGIAAYGSDVSLSLAVAR